jgi:hypothetical protein
MLRFIVGFGLVWAILLAWAFLDSRDVSWRPAGGEEWLLIGAKLLVVPLVIGWFALDLADRRRPRRLFDPRVRAGLMPIGAGFVAGIVSVVLAAVGLAVPAAGVFSVGGPSADYYDVGVIAVASATAAWGAALAFRRLRRGHCVHCGYDLSGGVGPRCPECGAVGSVA